MERHQTQEGGELGRKLAQGGGFVHGTVAKKLHKWDYQVGGQEVQMPQRSRKAENKH